MKELKQGEKLRWGYGYCWTNYDRNTISTFPVPFNIFLRWIRQLYFYLSTPARDKEMDKVAGLMSEIYHRGYEDGEKYASYRYNENLKTLKDALKIEE